MVYTIMYIKNYSSIGTLMFLQVPVLAYKMNCYLFLLLTTVEYIRYSED